MTRCRRCHQVIYPLQRRAVNPTGDKIHYACWVEWSIDLFDRQIEGLTKVVDSLIEATFPEREAVATKKSLAQDGWEYRPGGRR